MTKESHGVQLKYPGDPFVARPEFSFWFLKHALIQ